MAMTALRVSTQLTTPLPSYASLGIPVQPQPHLGFRILDPILACRINLPPRPLNAPGPMSQGEWARDS